MLSQHLSSALQRLDRRLLEVVDHEARRAAVLAADGAAGWQGVRNLARADVAPLLAAGGPRGPIAPAAPDLGFARIAEGLGLGQAGADLLLLLLAPFIEPRYQSLYAMLQDDAHQPLATERLVLAVLGGGAEGRQRTNAMLSPGGALRQSGFVQAVPGRHAPLRQPFTLPDEVAAALMDAREPLIAGADAQGWEEAPGDAAAPLPPARVFTGTGGLFDAALAALPGGARVFRARIAPEGKEDEVAAATCAAWRLGVARGAWPVVDLRLTATEAAERAAGRVARLVGIHGGRAWFLHATPLSVPLPHTPCRPGPWSARAAQWAEAAEAAGIALDAGAAGRIASRHRLERAEIAEVMRDLRRQVPEGATPKDASALIDAIARGRGIAAPRRAASRTPRISFDDLILRAATRAALDRLVHYIENRDRIDEGHPARRHFALDKGPVALFHGRPGTGKTIAAEATARALGRPFFVVDLSQLVSKYVGETEKHIDETLAEAERAGAVLFFDEADALFTRRVEKASSGGEQFSNMVVGYLLQRIEAHDGPIILATNMTQGMDEALMRRFRFRAEFPLPDAGERRQLWELMLGGVPEGVDPATLGRAHKLSGGEIRNAALKAIFLSDQRGEPIGQALLEEAVRLELYELGRLSRVAEAQPADDRGLILRAAGAALQERLEDHLRALFLKEIHVLEGPPSERNLSGFRPALSMAMFRLAGRRGTERARDAEALRLGFVLSAWCARPEEEHEILGVAHAFLSKPPAIEAHGRPVTFRLQESHDFEMLQRFWSSHDQPLKPSIVLDVEIG